MTEQVIEKKQNKKLIAIIAAIVVVAVIAVVVVMQIVGGSKNQVPKNLAKAQQYIQELDFDKAILAFEKVLSLDPKNVEAYKGIIEAYRGKGDIEKAYEYAKAGADATGDKDLTALEKELYNILNPESDERKNEVTDNNDQDTANQNTGSDEGTSEMSEELVASYNNRKHWKITADSKAYESIFGLYTYQYSDTGVLLREYDSFTRKDYYYNADGSLDRYDYYMKSFMSMMGATDDSDYTYMGTYWYNAEGYLSKEEAYWTLYDAQNGGRPNTTTYEYIYDDRGYPSYYWTDYDFYYMEYDENGNLLVKMPLEDNGEEMQYFNTTWYGYDPLPNGDSVVTYKALFSNSEGSDYEEYTWYTYDEYGNMINAYTSTEYVDGSGVYTKDLSMQYDNPAFPEGKPGDTFVQTVTIVYDGNTENAFTTEIHYQYFD